MTLTERVHELGEGRSALDLKEDLIVVISDFDVEMLRAGLLLLLVGATGGGLAALIGHIREFGGVRGGLVEVLMREDGVVGGSRLMCFASEEFGGGICLWGKLSLIEPIAGEVKDSSGDGLTFLGYQERTCLRALDCPEYVGVVWPILGELKAEYEVG